MDHTCPRCQQPLGDVRAGAVRMFPCEGCGGHAMTMSQLRAAAETQRRVGVMWQALRQSPPAQLACPSCRDPMRAAAVAGVEVDGCVRCQLLWLDAGEQEALVGVRPPPTMPTEEVRAAEIAAKQLIALDAVAEQNREAAERRRWERREGPLEIAFAVLAELIWWF